MCSRTAVILIVGFDNVSLYILLNNQLSDTIFPNREKSVVFFLSCLKRTADHFNKMKMYYIHLLYRYVPTKVNTSFQELVSPSHSLNGDWFAIPRIITFTYCEMWRGKHNLSHIWSKHMYETIH